MTQTVNLSVGDITGGDTTINRNDVSQAFAATKQVIEDLLNGIQPFDKILFETPETVVIDGSGAATVTLGTAYLSANSGTADNLDTLTIPAGIPVFLRATSGHTITIRDNGVGGGNIYIFSGGSLILSGEKTVQAIKMGTTIGIIGDGDTNAGAVTYVSEQATAGEALTDRKAAYVDESDGKIYHIDTDATPPKIGRIRGFVVGSVASGATATLATFGELNGFSSLTKHQPVYADTTPGGITQTRPVPTSGGSQIIIAQMGYARASDTIFIEKNPIYYNLRDAMVLNDTLTIQHHTDAEGYLRNVKAYVTEIVTGANVDNYASSNQDTQVGLQDRIPATYTTDLCTGGTPIGNMTATDGLAGAFDNNAATAAGIASVAGIIGYDFGASNDKTIRQYAITEDTTHSEANAPADWTFEYSDNNSDWFVADTQTSQTFTNGEIKTYPIANSGAHRYWRLNITDNSGSSGNLFVGELEMMEVSTWTNGAQKLSQSFTLSSASDIQSLAMYLRKIGSPTGTMTVRIETDSAGDPSGTLADANATQTLSESSLGTSFADETITFPASFNLSAATYHIVISTDRAASEINYVEWGADGSSPSYSGGEMQSYDGSLWNSESKDAVFAIYAPGTAYSSQINVDWWNSTHADLVNRYGNVSGTNVDTRTTFKCLRSAGLDDVTLEVVL